MVEPAHKVDIDEEAAELALLAAAVAEARASELKVPHEEARAWLLRVADGDLEAPPPKARKHGAQDRA